MTWQFMINIDPGPSTLTMLEREEAMATVAEEFRPGWRTALGAAVTLISTLAACVRWPGVWA